MAIVVQIIGVVMALGGLIGLVYGIDMLPTERGMAGTIASTVALSGGVITAALGLVIQRLDALRMAAPATALPKAKITQPPLRTESEDSDRGRIEPAIEATPAPVAAETRLPEIKLPEIRLPEVKAPEVAVEDKPRFKLPTLKIGAGAVAAGAAAGAVAASAGDLLATARDKTVETVTDTAEAVASLASPDPVDPPVEVLTPVEDAPDVELPPLLPEVDAAAYTEVPMPVEPAPKPAADDPFAAFDAELDKLIPLKSSKKGRGKKEPSREEPFLEAPAPVIEPEPVAPPAEPVDAIPAEVFAEPADLAPPPPAPAPGAEVVGAYESGGAKYTMYSDGSVVAEAEGQTLFFKSLEELRDFIDGPKA